jgi:flagellar biosynthetic protein FliR
MNVIELLVTPHLAQFALELARITGLIILTPIPWEAAPRQVKAGMVLFLGLVVHAASDTPVDLGGPLQAALHIFSEFALGAAMGFVVRLSVAVAEIAGTTVAPIMGFGAAAVFDPATGQSDTVLTRLFRQLFILLALALGVHRVILGALVSSFHALPVGSTIHLAAGAPVFIELSSKALAAGVTLALPALAILTMVQLALAFVSRAAPSMQIFSVGFAVLLATGAVVVYATTPDLAHQMMDGLGGIGRVLEEVVYAFAKGV